MDELSKYQLLPPLTDEEYGALKNDIGQRGVLVAIEVDEVGNTLDGYHRLRACKELGIKDYPAVVRIRLNEDEKIEHSLKLNLSRRHLDRGQLKDLAVKLRQRGWGQEKVGQALGVSQRTVSNWLGEFSKIAKLDRSEGVTGREWAKCCANAMQG